MTTASEAVAYFRTSGDIRLAEVLHHLATIAWVFSDYDGAERWCEEARTSAETAAQAGAVASIIHTLGVIEASRNETETGRQLISNSIELLRALPDADEPLLLPVALGYGRMPRARPGHRPPRLFLEQTFVTARRVEASGAVAYALCDLAAAARNADDSETSQRLLEESLSIFQRLGDQLGVAQALAQLGNLHCAKGEFELSQKLLAESLAIRQHADDARGIGLSLLASAVTAAHSGDLDLAEMLAGRALALFDRTDDVPGRGSAVTQLGYIAADRGRPEAARELLERALHLWRGFIPNTLWCTRILWELAELDVALGDSDRVAQRLLDASAICLHNGDEVGRVFFEEALTATANGVLTPQ
jgi:tetratricopeptide (TPR) repeat protein